MEFLAQLKLARQKKGDHLVEFLKTCRCTSDPNAMKKYLDSNGNDEIPVCKDVATYESSTFRIHKMKELSTGNTNYTEVSPIMQTYTNQIVEKYTESFVKDKKVLEYLKIFDPLTVKKRMPRNEQVKIRQLGDLLNIKDSHQFIRLWPKFRQDLVTLPIFCDNKDTIFKEPEKFWAHVLNTDKIQIDGPIRTLLQTILVIPLGK